jgi:hypothetical protein
MGVFSRRLLAAGTTPNFLGRVLMSRFEKEQASREMNRYADRVGAAGFVCGRPITACRSRTRELAGGGACDAGVESTDEPVSRRRER